MDNREAHYYLEELQRMMTQHRDIFTEEFVCANGMAIQALEKERKKGKWIPVTNGRGGYECDKCHNYAPSYQDGVEWLSKFCPNCGSPMEVEEENG